MDDWLGSGQPAQVAVDDDAVEAVVYPSTRLGGKTVGRKTIQRRAAEHAGRFVTIGPLALFSTETGDAWLPSSATPPAASQDGVDPKISNMFGQSSSLTADRRRNAVRRADAVAAMNLVGSRHFNSPCIRRDTVPGGAVYRGSHDLGAGP